MLSPYHPSIKLKPNHKNANDCCPLLHLLTLLTTFESKRQHSQQDKIKIAFQQLFKFNADQIPLESFQALVQCYDSYLMDMPHGQTLIQLLLSKITKSLRPSVTVQLLQILAQQHHRNKKFQLQTKNLYEAFEIGLLMKKKSFRTFNFGVRACQMMPIKEFEKKSNCLIVALRHQIESNTQTLLKNISQASKVYGLKLKNKGQKKETEKENKKEFLKRVFQRSSSKSRNFSHHMNQRDQVEVRLTHKQKSGSKKNNKNLIFNNSTAKVLNKNQLMTQSVRIEKLAIDNSQQDQILSQSRLTVHHQQSSDIYAKIQSKLKSKSQILPFYILLYEMYSICVLRFTSEVKKKYFRDFRTELKEKLLRQYPGRNIQQVLFDIELDKIKMHQLRNDAKWTQNLLTHSSVLKTNNHFEKNSQNRSIMSQNLSMHKNSHNSLSKNQKGDDENTKVMDYQISEFTESVSQSAVITNKQSKVLMGVRMKKSCHQFSNSQLNRNISDKEQITFVQKDQKHQKNDDRIKQSQNDDKPDGIFKRIRSRKLSSRSQHQVGSSKRIGIEDNKTTKRQDDIQDQFQMNSEEKYKIDQVKNTIQVLELQIQHNKQIKETVKKVDNSEISANRQIQINGSNILQRLKKSNKKQKGTLKKKAKQVIQQKKFINQLAHHDKVDNIKIPDQNHNHEETLSNNGEVKDNIQELEDFSLQQNQTHDHKQGKSVEEDKIDFIQNQQIVENIKQKEQQQPPNHQKEQKEKDEIQPIETEQLSRSGVSSSSQTFQQQKEIKQDLQEEFDNLVKQYLTKDLENKILQQDITQNENESEQKDNDESESLNSLDSSQPDQVVVNPHQLIDQKPQQTTHQLIEPQIELILKVQTLDQSTQKHYQSQKQVINKPQQTTSDHYQNVNQKNMYAQENKQPQRENDKDQQEQQINQINWQQIETFLTQTYQSLASKYIEETFYYQQQQQRASEEMNNGKEQKHSKPNDVQIDHRTPNQIQSQYNQEIQSHGIINFYANTNTNVIVSQEKSKNDIEQFTEQYLYDLENVLLSDKQFVDVLISKRATQLEYHDYQSKININNNFQSSVSGFDSSDTQGQNLHPINEPQSPNQYDLSQKKVSQKQVEMIPIIQNGPKQSYKTSIKEIAMTPSQNLIVNAQQQSQAHTLRLINPLTQTSLPSKSIFYEPSPQRNLNAPQSPESNSQYSILESFSPLNQSITLIPPLNLNEQENTKTQEQSKQPNLRSSINNAFDEITDLIHNSLIKSNNLLGEVLNVSRKSIIKSDSRIKSKNTINSNRESQKGLAPQEGQLHPSKPKSVKISAFAREQTISTSRQSHSISIHSHILKPQIKISQSCVSLSIYHPYEKKSFKVEREFIHSINVKDYTKGLQARITKYLDYIMAESFTTTHRTSYTTEFVSKSKNHRHKKSSFERHEIPTGSVLNWENIIEKVNLINLEPQLINLKSMKIEFKKSQSLTVCLMHYLEYNRIVIEYKKNPLQLRPVQISVDLNESVDDIRSLFNEKNVKVELIEINNEIKATLQVYNLWCLVQTIAISLKNSSSKLKSVFKLYQFVFKTKQTATRYNMLIRMEFSEGQTQNIVISDLGLEDRNKLLNNLSIVVGYAVKIDQGKSKFIVNGKEIKEFLNML